jgi:hypothetical protein
MPRLVVNTIKVRMIALEVVGSLTVGRERAKREVRGARRSEGNPRCNFTGPPHGTIAAHSSSSSIAIISTSSWDNIDDILDDRTHATNPASYLIRDQDHRSTFQHLRPRKGAEYTIEQAIRGSLSTTGLARKQPLPHHSLIPPTVSIDVWTR